MKQIIALDFDGVIHSYTTPWNGADIISDPPVEGAMSFIRKVLDSKFDLVIYSTRSCPETNGIENAERGKKAIKQYLIDNGLAREDANQIDVVSSKPRAVVYIDDRAWRFEGTFPTIGMIDAFTPWTKRK